MLELLWPPNHGIPGPHITESQMRDAINDFRVIQHKGIGTPKPYLDVFRRVRELQGEEGLIGITKQGKTYQLISLEIAEKRVPRTALNKSDWEIVITTYHNKCAVCGRSGSEVSFQQDHKIPRLRGGGPELLNWQPLCDECNNFKSSACRACQLNCLVCPWAFPEKYKPLKIDSENVEQINKQAQAQNIDPSELVNQILGKFFKN